MSILKSSAIQTLTNNDAQLIYDLNDYVKLISCNSLIFKNLQLLQTRL